MLAASLFGGGGATPRGVTQAAVVSQALASGIPPASAAAMLAATSGQNHPGGPTSGPAGDAANVAAMMAAGMMRGWVYTHFTSKALECNIVNSFFAVTLICFVLYLFMLGVFNCLGFLERLA